MPSIQDTFLKLDVMHGAFSLNVVALTYERMSINKPFLKYELTKTTSGIWLTALYISIPSIFMVQYTKNSTTKFEACKEVNRFLFLILLVLTFIDL